MLAPRQWGKTEILAIYIARCMSSIPNTSVLYLAHNKDRVRDFTKSRMQNVLLQIYKGDTSAFDITNVQVELPNKSILHVYSGGSDNKTCAFMFGGTDSNRPGMRIMIFDDAGYQIDDAHDSAIQLMSTVKVICHKAGTVNYDNMNGFFMRKWHYPNKEQMLLVTNGWKARGSDLVYDDTIPEGITGFVSERHTEELSKKVYKETNCNERSWKQEQEQEYKVVDEDEFQGYRVIKVNDRL